MLFVDIVCCLLSPLWIFGEHLAGVFLTLDDYCETFENSLSTFGDHMLTFCEPFVDLVDVPVVV